MAIFLAHANKSKAPERNEKRSLKKKPSFNKRPSTVMKGFMTFPRADSKHGQTLFNPGQYSYCDHFWVHFWVEITDVKLLINSLNVLGLPGQLINLIKLQRHEFLHLLASSLKNHPWKVQLSIFTALIGYVNKVSDDEDV
ncbi:uncharacterized protein LOC124434105 [Xenia sp. Carnegie-2017]|uniref:uncharacterized protein LOC124434105 n=1 Tax=Xenia sp. Carnegie-2017 TaxID=2897299 RepID=UPI001F04F33D|nr:uncharacterized protein LOC124434105 [Xenia sp. Carnegie-2017]